MQKAISKFKTPNHIRAALMLKGFTVLSFARTYGYRPSTVYAAARGERLGIIGSSVKRHLEEVSR